MKRRKKQNMGVGKKLGQEKFVVFLLHYYYFFAEGVHGFLPVYLSSVNYIVYLPSVSPKAWLSRLWVENLDLHLLTPVFWFVTPGRKVWAITALNWPLLKHILII